MKHETGNYHHYDHHDSFRLMAQALSSFFRPVCVFFYQHALPPETGAENYILKKWKKGARETRTFRSTGLVILSTRFYPRCKSALVGLSAAAGLHLGKPPHFFGRWVFARMENELPDPRTPFAAWLGPWMDNLIYMWRDKLKNCGSAWWLFLSRPHIFSPLCGRLFQIFFHILILFFMFQWWKMITFNMGKSH